MLVGEEAGELMAVAAAAGRMTGKAFSSSSHGSAPLICRPPDAYRRNEKRDKEDIMTECSVLCCADLGTKSLLCDVLLYSTTHEVINGLSRADELSG